VKVDVIGIGASVVDALNRMNNDDELPPGVSIVSINVAEVADDENEYHLLRDQLWFGAQLWLKQGGILKPDDDLRTELIAPKYLFDARARRQVEAKKDIKKRLGHSCDNADALCLAVYSPNVAIGDTDVPGVSGSRWDDWEEGERGFG
jgi:hypothetical protein